MSMITKSEWNDWKQNQVTRAFFAAADMRIEDAKEILAVTAGMDVEENNWYRGFIAAYREMFDFRVEDLVDD